MPPDLENCRRFWECSQGWLSSELDNARNGEGGWRGRMELGRARAGCRGRGAGWSWGRARAEAQIWHSRTWKSCRAAWSGNFANLFLLAGKITHQARLFTSSLAARDTFSSNCGYLLYAQISLLFPLTFSLRNKDVLFLILLFQLSALKEQMLLQGSEEWVLATQQHLPGIKQNCVQE